MGKVKPVKPGKVRSNGNLRVRQKPFNQATRPDRAVESLIDESVAESVNSEDSHAPSIAPSGQQCAFGGEHVPSRPSGQSHATRKRNEEDSYQELRPKCVSTMQMHTYLTAEVDKATFLRETLHGFLVGATLKAFCKGCGCPAKDCPKHATRPGVEVSFISESDTFALNVPIYECPRYISAIVQQSSTTASDEVLKCFSLASDNALSL